ncbi:MAG: SUMF1/EgtB/PvdO family nonheme iron enzyme [Halieaceae bacterium]|jgi:eukaryotic-like serine/threonine-protein kinase|nr:SUMF1/EgtB/PvdO family nonheme iron enzyme [Halieaceae bacterium]
MANDKQGLFNKLRAHPVIRAGTTYAAAAFLIVQVIGLIADSFGFGDNLMQGVIWASFAGFPVVILLSLIISSHFSTLKLLLITVLLVTGGYLGGAFYWVQFVKSPELETALSKDQYAKSWIIARDMSQVFPFLPQLDQALSQLGRPAKIEIMQNGVDVYWKPFASDEYHWEFLGTSPLDPQNLPVGPLQFRLEKEGFQTAYLGANNPSLALKNFPVKLEFEASKFELAKDDDVPEGMVYIPGGEFLPAITGEGLTSYVLSPYYIDKYEVTNKQFKQFVDAQGYKNPRYWQDTTFINDGRTLSLEQALTLMVDQTGRNAPASWELADYPEGSDDLPVTGISWYEAQAYANYKGNTLPPLYHWAKAAFPVDEVVSPLAPAILANSNFAGKELRRVSQSVSIGPYGTFDMAGNAREWVWNIFGGEGITIGGAIAERQYMGFQSESRPRIDRSAHNGFRTVKLLNPADMNPFGDPLSLPALPPKDFYQPMDAKAFKFYSQPYSYGKRKLNAKTAYVEENHDDWIKEKVSVEVGYNNERMDILIFRPKNISSNIGSVVFYPGLGAFRFPGPLDKINPGDFGLDYIIKSGRALILPAFKESRNRSTDPSFLDAATDEQKRVFRDTMTKWRIDTGRVLDYIEERPEFSDQNIHYMGMSFGAIYTPIVLLFEQRRFKSAVYLSGGLDPYKPPLSDGIVYQNRIKTPTLMLNGEQDYLMPISGQQALFDLLGAAPSDKKYIAYDAGHWPLPRNQMVNEVLAWFEKYESLRP